MKIGGDKMPWDAGEQLGESGKESEDNVGEVRVSAAQQSEGNEEGEGCRDARPVWFVEG